MFSLVSLNRGRKWLTIPKKIWSGNLTRNVINRKMGDYTVLLGLTPSASDPATKLLDNAVKSVGTYFQSHVPLIAVKSKNPESVIGQLKEFAKSQKAVNVTLGKLTKGSDFHNHAYFSVDASQNNQLADLRRSAESIWKASKIDTPLSSASQLSVLFSDKDVFDVLSRNLVSLSSVVLSSVSVVVLPSSVKDLANYRYFGSATLGTSAFYRSAYFINGEWQGPAGNTWDSYPVVNPANKSVIHSFLAGGKKEVDAAVDAATKAFPAWSQLTATERSKYLLAVADEIEKSAAQLIETEVTDNGKPIGEATEDVNDTVKCFRYYANMAIDKEKEQDKTIEGVHKQFNCYVRREPVGVCGLIIPWNYPLLMLAWKVAPCLAAGCTAVLKPSELTSLNALEIGAICSRAGLPQGVLNIVCGLGPQAGEALSLHPGVHKLAFTGSVPTGSHIMSNAALAVKRCSLELGGKSPIIVYQDADVEQAVDWISVGIFFNAGQVCSATSRLIVHESVKDQVLSGLINLINGIKIGNGLDASTKLGPLVSEGQFNRVAGYIKKGLDEGARLVTGGVPTSGELTQGYFIKPTIFDNVNPDMTIWKEEIFGPVLSVMTFKDPATAIQLANSSEYGLGAAVLSRNLDLCHSTARMLQAGIVWINCSQPTFVEMPWGGVKKSGIGRELGPWGLENYIEIKQVTAWADPNDKGWGWFVAKV
eukprot:TRINITY_DN2333_c0_g1_i3.p1 TRINITY_DN2333_c0_g1~~TRINITY_DN2333_c0_g1_i3.p1  ORF type:complete len:705 (+),score=192.87 TRINITY_DN2333_c0_g1_i3:9-2123(+)